MSDPRSGRTLASATIPGDTTHPLADRWLAVAVLLFAVALAAFLYVHFWQNAHALWWGGPHDRHAHYLHGLNLAWDVRTGNLPRLRHDLDALRVWGPLHALCVFLIELPAGPDHRLAVLPSLVGWVLTIWFGFLVARRMLPSHANLAGLVAAALLAGLPAHRAFATDVMLESGGAALSLLVLYCYLVTLQDRSRRPGVALALALIALFFWKYNYWLLVVFGLVASEILRRPVPWFVTLRGWLLHRLIPIARCELRQPLTWLAVGLFALALFVWRMQPTGFSIGRFHIRGGPHNLFTFAFWALFLRLLLWWRQQGRLLVRQFDPRLRTVLVWHGWASALWFLLPKRLGYFLWFLSPANCDREFKHLTILDGFFYYLKALAEDYCVWPGELFLLLGLAALALFALPRLRPGSAAVFTFVLIGALLTMQHAMTKNRHAHTWATATWVLAAVGLVAGVERLARRMGVRATSWAVGAVSVAVMALHVPAYLAPGRAQEGGLKPEVPSPLVMTDAYLGHLADARQTTILSNIPARYLYGWTFIERHRHLGFETTIRRFEEELQHDPVRLGQWLDSTTSDAVVLIEVDRGSPFAYAGKGSANLTTLRQVLERQNRFLQSERLYLPEKVSISVWKKEGKKTLSAVDRMQPARLSARR